MTRLAIDEHGRIRDDVAPRPSFTPATPPAPRLIGLGAGGRERRNKGQGDARYPANGGPEPRGWPLWISILREVCWHHGAALEDVVAGRRWPGAALSRRQAWFEMRERTTLSWPEIGRASGGFDHTTCMHQAKLFAREAGIPRWRG